jgi:toluene monooxygenase system protein E
MPPEYEIVSSDLHYNHSHRFELPDDNPVVAWYYRHREGSPLQAHDWEVFSDPRRTTYRGYNELQDRKEDVIDGLLREIDDTDYDNHLAAAWVAFLDRWYAPLRFPAHGLQMLAAYVAQLAPASRITNCAAFQTTDEMRRLQRIAYRTAQLASHRSGVDIAQHRRTWEEAEEFQPLRELIERALVTYDWGEAFVLTNIVIKPHIDRLINEEIAGALAAANGDPMLQSIHFSLDEDARWHREWTTALLHVAIADTPANVQVVSEWIDRWQPLVVAAGAALAGVTARAPVAGDPKAVATRINSSVARSHDVLVRAFQPSDPSPDDQTSTSSIGPMRDT